MRRHRHQHHADQGNHGFSAQTLTTQFRAGIRALDIRVRLDKGDEGLKFTIHHGAAYQYANFTDVLNATRDFLRDEPDETVLLHLKAECDGGTFGCEDAEGYRTDEWRKKVFDSYLDGRSYTGDGDESTKSTAWRDLFWAPSVTGKSQAGQVPSLGEVRGKVVLMGYRATKGGIYDGYGIKQPYPAGGSNEEYVQDAYEVDTISDIAGKWEKVRAHLRKTNGRTAVRSPRTPRPPRSRRASRASRSRRPVRPAPRARTPRTRRTSTATTSRSGDGRRPRTSP